MNISCTVGELQKAASICRRSIGGAQNPVLSCLYIRTDGDNRVALAATNMEAYSDVWIDGDVGAQGGVLLEADRLCPALDLMPEDATVSIIEEDGKATVRCGKSSYVFPTISVDDIPIGHLLVGEHGRRLGEWWFGEHFKIKDADPFILDGFRVSRDPGAAMRALLALAEAMATDAVMLQVWFKDDEWELDAAKANGGGCSMREGGPNFPTLIAQACALWGMHKIEASGVAGKVEER